MRCLPRQCGRRRVRLRLRRRVPRRAGLSRFGRGHAGGAECVSGTGAFERAPLRAPMFIGLRHAPRHRRPRQARATRAAACSRAARETAPYEPARASREAAPVEPRVFDEPSPAPVSDEPARARRAAAPQQSAAAAFALAVFFVAGEARASRAAVPDEPRGNAVVLICLLRRVAHGGAVGHAADNAVQGAGAVSTLCCTDCDDFKSLHPTRALYPRPRKARPAIAPARRRGRHM
mmetsp:Transcript_12116/g.40427  ORF Transcript_12116/g.40427 Transcript_12116/m.40427 type:complete len:234 (-) Transcript_12116:65-766(-)